MYATLLTAVLLAQTPQPATGTQTQTDRNAGRAGMANPLDGSWTVVSLERQGQPVADVSGMTVTVRNGTVTFDGGQATSRMQPMRLEFGAMGTIRVSDAAGSGTGTGPSGSGTGTGAGAGTASGQPRTATGGAGALDRSHMRTGVVVHTRDYAAVTIFDAAGAGTGTGSGTGRSGAGSGSRTTPGGTGSGTTPGGTGTSAGSGQGAGTGTGSDRSAGTGGSSGQTPYLVVFLKKTGVGSGTTRPERP